MKNKESLEEQPWIGVDFDGTLVTYPPTINYDGIFITIPPENPLPLGGG